LAKIITDHPAQGVGAVFIKVEYTPLPLNKNGQ